MSKGSSLILNNCWETGIQLNKCKIYHKTKNFFHLLKRCSFMKSMGKFHMNLEK